MSELPAPDSEYLTSLQTELSDLYLQQDNDIDNYREQREMRTPSLAEADRDYVLVHVDPRDPDITEEAFQQTAMLTLDRPKLSIVGGEGDTAETIATKLEHFTEQTLWTCGTREPGTDTMTQITDSALNDGGGWSKILWARDIWDSRYSVKRPTADESAAAYQEYDKATEDAKKSAGPPFAWCYVDPRSVYPQWSNGYLCEVLEVSQMPRRAAFRRYRLSLDGQGNIVPEELGQKQNIIEASRSALSTVTFYEHWDETWVSYAVVGQNYSGDKTGYIVKQFRHKYPFGVPYDYAPGLTMSHWKNRKVGWGIGRTKLWLVKYRQYLRAMHAQYVARDLLSPLVTYGDTPSVGVIGDDGLPRGTDEPRTVHPGEILNLPAGRQLNRIPYPDASTLEKHMSLIDQAIRDLESPRVTTLSGMEGAGFAISQVLQYTRTRVGPVRHGLERLLEGQTHKLWDLIKSRAGEKVWVFYGGGPVGSEQAVAEYIGFGPKDLERPMHIAWEVQAQLPTDEMIMARYAHERLAAGTYGKDEAVTYLGDNPDEIRRSIARDEIRASPAYKKWLYAEVFANAGRGDILEKAQQAEQMALAGNIPAGQPGLGPGGPPGQQPQPGVFEGGGPGLGGVPDLAALAAAPGGAGVAPPPYGAVVAGAQQPGGAPPAPGP